MDLDLPSHLHSTRDLLMRSLVMHPEQAPAMPAGLAADLNARFSPRPAAVAPVKPVAWLDKVRSFLATPAFGLAAAAVVVMGIALPMVSQPAAPKETFRGQTTAVSAEPVRILFAGSNPEIVSAIRNSGEFEAAAIATLDQTATSTDGPAVIVDFKQGTVSSIDRDGSVLHREALPGDASGVAAAIASALSRF